MHLFSSRHHDAQALARLPLRVFVTLCVRATVRLRSRERAFLSVQAGMRYAYDGKAERTTLPNDFGCKGLSHATNMQGHVNTKRVWMGQRECAAQQRNKKSILINVPTRQCFRKRKRDKTEPSLQEHQKSARKQRNGSIAERHKTEVKFHQKGPFSKKKENKNFWTKKFNCWREFAHRKFAQEKSAGCATESPRWPSSLDKRLYPRPTQHSHM